MRIDLKIKGLDKLTKGLKRFPNNLRSEFRVAMETSIALIEMRTKPITPWETGHMRRSIRRDYIRPFEAAIAPHVDYAVFIHEGTRYYPLSMPPKKPGMVRQFMKVGLEKSKPTIEGLFNSAVEKALMKSIYGV